MIIPILEGLTLTKGHAGGRDAIIVPDFEGRRDITADDVARLCERRAGIGADALMRVVRDGDAWRIDAWDSNGAVMADPDVLVRLAAHHLHVSGLLLLDEGASVDFETGAGTRQVTRIGGGYAAELEAVIPATDEGVQRGFDAAVTLDGVDGMRGGLTIASDPLSIVVAVEHGEELNSATGTAQYDPEPRSADLVLVYPEGDAMMTDFDGVDRPVTRFALRAFRDGADLVSGQAIRDAAVALHTWAGETATGIYHADCAGYRTEVRLTGGAVEITGPAEIVAEFNLAGIAGEGR